MSEATAKAPAADGGVKGGTRAGRLLVRLDRAAGRRWFPLALGVFPVSDYAVPVLPNQLLLLGLSALHPRRRMLIGATFVCGSALGAFLVTLAVGTAGPWLSDTLGGLLPGAAELDEVRGFVAGYGAWALAVLALLPWTPRAAVVVCALSGVPPLAAGAAVLAGRTVPVALLVLAGARAARLLPRSRRLARVLAEAEAARRSRPGTQGAAAETGGNGAASRTARGEKAGDGP
jgi:uncharacterized membrane protein YdjX (TVP38/TMEM64 family)